jgi:threonine dehydrogenase-like Zn-dependent dehydrogenase
VLSTWPAASERRSPELLALVASGRLHPQDLVTRELVLDEAGEALRDVGREPGITVVTSF